jgi:hypothetical protein
MLLALAPAQIVEQRQTRDYEVSSYSTYCLIDQLEVVMDNPSREIT